MTNQDFYFRLLHPGRYQQFRISASGQKQAFGGLSRRNKSVYTNVRHSESCLSSFEVASDALLFIQRETTETTSGAPPCDPHSADMKVTLIDNFNRGEKYTDGGEHNSFILGCSCRAVEIQSTGLLDRRTMFKQQSAFFGGFSLILLSLQALKGLLRWCVARCRAPEYTLYISLMAGWTMKSTKYDRHWVERLSWNLLHLPRCYKTCLEFFYF